MSRCPTCKRPTNYAPMGRSKNQHNVTRSVWQSVHSIFNDSELRRELEREQLLEEFRLEEEDGE